MQQVSSARRWAALLADRDTQALISLAIVEDTLVTPIGTDLQRQERPISSLSGDITTSAIFAAPRSVQAQVIAREETVVCGVPLAWHVLQHFDASAQLLSCAAEGALIGAGQTMFRMAADVRAVLTAERTMLNFLMRLCGIATAARRAVEAIPVHCKARILDTRKTMPGWRRLDKAAVAIGGADNHRFGLYDAALIKDNHVQAAGSVSAAIAAVRAHGAACGLPIEVEVDTLEQLDEALACSPDIILLDNFALDTLREAVRRAAGRVVLEVSGGVTLERIAAIAATGVDRISMGSLTHSVRPPDLTLELE